MYSRILRRPKLVGALIGFHLSVMILGILDPKIPGPRWPWEALRFYGKWTGATATYGFFSPEIPREIVYSFTLHFADGTTREATLQETANHEVNARIGNILRLFAKNYKKKEIVRSLAASITASMFKEFPEAEKIEIRGQLHKLPTMAEYRAGLRPEFIPVYSATFRRPPGGGL